MPVAWERMRIPGAPTDFALTSAERFDPDPVVRYHRRTIQAIEAGGERLVLVDKASPHALHDLMVSGLAVPPRAGPDDVAPPLGRALWGTALAFVRFVSDPDVQRAYGLTGGRLHLALNCDPNTQDRESCQADKQFHLHLLYWTAEELAPLRQPERVADFGARLRRQALDPLAFLGARLLQEALEQTPLPLDGARLLADEVDAILAGHRPPGCLIALPGWAALQDPAFEPLVRTLHRRIAAVSADLLAAFTGRREAPPPWQRHPLLSRREIETNLARLPWSAAVRGGLRELAARLHDLPGHLAKRLRTGPPAPRKHHMALNQPCYSLNLHAPVVNTPEQPLAQAGPVWLILQTKLFSGIGGAGLVSLADVPSVRILRGEGTYDARQWHHRARFQRAFARFNGDMSTATGLRPGAAARFIDFTQGWRQAVHPQDERE